MIHNKTNNYLRHLLDYQFVQVFHLVPLTDYNKEKQTTLKLIVCEHRISQHTLFNSVEGSAYFWLVNINFANKRCNSWRTNLISCINTVNGIIN